MGQSRPLGVRSFALATAALIVSSLLTVVPTAAQADTSPVAGTPETVSTDILPAPQIDGVNGGIVWTQAIVGDLVYAGGNFTSARPYLAAKGVNSVTRSNLLSYNINTGVLTSFAPTFNGTIRGVTGSPDGSRLYVVGEFTTVNGQPRSRIAAFNTSTGALISTFAPIANTRVNTVVATATEVFVGGWLTSVKVGSTNYARKYAAGFTASNGAITPFNPDIAGGTVTAMVMAPDRSKLVVGGSFTSVAGVDRPGYGLAALNPSTGASLPWLANNNVRDAGTASGITSLSADADSVYGTGYQYTLNGGGGNLEGAFRASWTDGALQWVEDCHGDSYSVAPQGDTVYVVSHAHFCGNVGGHPEQDIAGTDKPMTQRAMAWSKAGTRTITSDTQGYANWAGKTAPEILNWWPDLTTGQASGQGQAAWSVAANSDFVVIAGEFGTVNNKAQQGLARFGKKSIAPNKDGPRLSGANYVPTAESVASGSINVTWPANYDRDNEFLTYQLIRNGATSTPISIQTVGSRIWYDRPVMSFLDTGRTPGQTYTYRVRVVDPFGNAVSGGDVSVAASATGTLSSYHAAVLGDQPRSYWRLGDTTTTVVDYSTNLDAKSNPNVVRGAAGAIPGDADKASSFNGTNSLAATQTAIWAPDRLGLEAWFKSSSTTGGKIVGFGNKNTGVSAAFDRDIYLSTTGVVSFGTNSTGDRRVQSAAGFNDGRWHHVVANLSLAGEELFVDGVRVSSRADVISGREIFGFWRIGGDATRQGGNPFFNGTIDEVAVYDQPLAPAAVTEHYGIGSGNVVNAAPTASFTVATTGLAATVDASASSDSDGSIVSYAWNFGDGATANTATASHTYASAGTYQVTLTVTDDDGAVSTLVKPVAPSSANVAPTASFTTSATGLALNVNGSGSSDPDGSIASYAWSFGDGGTATGATATHTYGAAGTFSVKLTVTDDKGATGSTTKSVTVTPVGVPTPLAQDAFGRTVSGGLGNAEIGGAWTISGAASGYSVASGIGRLTTSSAGITQTAYLGSVSSTDTEVRATTSLLQASSGTGTYVSVIGRRTATSNYQARVKILPSGSTTLQLLQGGTTLTSIAVSGLSYATGDKLQMRLQVTGTSPTTLRAKVWKSGTTEPSGWQLTTTDSTASLQSAGSVGISTYISGSATVLPITVSFDDLWAGAPQ